MHSESLVGWLGSWSVNKRQNNSHLAIYKRYCTSVTIKKK